MVKTLFFNICISVCMIVLTAGTFDAANAQCLAAPPAPACSGTEPLAADGQTIASSDSKWFYGSARVFSSLTISGGTLIICGDLTINSFNFNSGTIFIRPGASLTITSGPSVLMEGGCYIYNYGQLTLQRGLAMDNAHVSAAQPNVFINAGTASVFNMLFDWMVINNPYSWFVNEGVASMHGIVTDPLSAAGSVCQGAGGRIMMSVLINNANRTYSAPSGAACVAVSGNSYICEQVSGDATLHVCLGPAHGTDSSCLVSRGKTKPWGNALLFPGCTNCNAVAILPIQFSNFAVQVRGSVNYLEWQTDGGGQDMRWQVQRSEDGVTYKSIAVAVRELAGGYSCRDEQPLAGVSYYRILYEAPSGGAGSSRVAVVKREGRLSGPGPSISPNPFQDVFMIHMPSGEMAEDISVMDTRGVRVVRICSVRSEDIVINGNHLPAGIYLVRIVTPKGVYLQRVIRK